MEVDCQSVKARMDGGAEFLLLDVREQEEFDIVSIEGSTLIPMSTIQDRVDELLPHKDDDIVVLCHGGIRSLQVAMWLKQQDFARVSSMRGGIDAWAMLVDPSLPRY